ncbi:MAG TPA: ATP-binding protein [Plasticicumulans sp.]|uniref:sensor histidine kinase n=1 Tax=Plasticicumulans sp. TaxID=2307179 RepID=UPI002CF1520C|nr:ATP-binding protein [Plasticicumulans sp.]HNG50432.1 ATP-binding protein [Plasticicumulans sp.]
MPQSPRQSATAGIVAAGVLLVAATAAGLWAIQKKHAIDLEATRAAYIQESHQRLLARREQVEIELGALARGLRAIARLPAVQAQGPAGAAEPETAAAIGEIFLGQQRLRPQRLLVVGTGSDAPMPYRLDAVTVLPWTAPRKAASADCTARSDALLDERLRGQLAYLQQQHPRANAVPWSAYPAIGARAVPDCLDPDGAGHFLWTVPVYATDGTLSGAVAVVLPSRALAAAIGAGAEDGNFALYNADHDYLVAGGPGGEAGRAAGWIRQQRAAPDTIYSETMPLGLAGAARGWLVWYGRPDSDWATRPDVLGADRFHRLAQAVVIGLAVVAALALALGARRRRVLERLVAERTRELHESQAALVQAGRLEGLGTLAAGIAHEIKNPLAWTRSNLDVCVDHARTLASLSKDWREAQQPGTDTDARALKLGRTLIAAETFVREETATELMQLLEDCADGTTRIQAIVEAVGSFSRLDQRQVASTEIPKLVASVLSIAGSEIRKCGARIDTRYAEDLPAIICAPGQLAQVLLNLVVNACHAMQGAAEHRLTISAELHARGRRVRLVVSDTGCGIPAEIRDHIFDPFFTTKDVGKGTGLGLHLAHQIVRAHGGRILVDSTPGHGASFTLDLPVDASAELAAAAPVDAAATTAAAPRPAGNPDPSEPLRPLGAAA